MLLSEEKALLLILKLSTLYFQNLIFWNAIRNIRNLRVIIKLLFRKLFCDQKDLCKILNCFFYSQLLFFLNFQFFKHKVPFFHFHAFFSLQSFFFPDLQDFKFDLNLTTSILSLIHELPHNLILAKL